VKNLDSLTWKFVYELTRCYARWIYLVDQIVKMQIESCIRRLVCDMSRGSSRCTMQRVSCQARKAHYNALCVFISQKVLLSQHRSAWLLLLDKHVKALAIPPCKHDDKWQGVIIFHTAGPLWYYEASFIIENLGTRGIPVTRSCMHLIKFSITYLSLHNISCVSRRCSSEKRFQMSKLGSYTIARAMRSRRSHANDNDRFTRHL
jgi:hypothetical protein